MRNNTNLATETPYAIAAAIIVCTCCEAAGLFGEGSLSVQHDALLRLLYFGSLVWSLMFTVQTIKQLKLRKIEQLFWFGIAAVPLLFSMLIAV